MPTNPPRRSAYITFEGIDGCGKTSVMQAIGQRLAAEGLDVVVTKEPGNPFDAGCRAIRELLLDPRRDWADRAELFLYLADRAQHIEKVVNPALDRGAIVLSDRGLDSTVAYQAFGRQEIYGTIDRLNLLATRGVEPTLTLFLDVDPEVAQARLAAAGKGDRMDNLGLDFYKRAQDGFRFLLTRNRRIRVIDASMPFGAVESLALDYVQQHLRTGAIAGGFTHRGRITKLTEEPCPACKRKMWCRCDAVEIEQAELRAAIANPVPDARLLVPDETSPAIVDEHESYNMEDGR